MKVVTSDLIATGNTAKIYLQDDKIIKIYKDSLPNNEAQYEANKQRYACACGLPVPQILEVTQIEGKQALVMEYAEGRTIGALMYEYMDQAEHYMTLSVEMQQKIHAIEASTFETMAKKLTRQIKSARILNHKQKSVLLQKLDAMPTENKLCHGDFHVFNLLMSKDRITIIDWVDASAGDAQADVCRSYLLYSQFSTELAEMYLRLYCEKSNCTKEGILSWMPVVAGARLSENVSSENTDRLVKIVTQWIEEGAYE